MILEEFHSFQDVLLFKSIQDSLFHENTGHIYQYCLLLVKTTVANYHNYLMCDSSTSYPSIESIPHD